MAALLLTSALTTTAQTEPIRIDLGQKGHVVTSQEVGVLGVAAEHQHLPSVVTAHAASLRGIPQVPLRVLHPLHDTL